jgi:lysylphosphatidylglycerol synthetase-like protein (DUF2156 family)
MKILAYIRGEQLKYLLREPQSQQMHRFVIFSLIYLFCLFLLTLENKFIYCFSQCAFLILIHFFRSDYKLLKKMGLPVYAILLTEYMLLSLPGIIIIIFFNHSIGFGILFMFVFLLPGIQSQVLFWLKHLFGLEKREL